MAAKSMLQRGRSDQVKPDPAQGSIVRSHTVGLELRTPMHVLNKDELQKALGKDRLPRHMAAVPTLQVPALSASRKDIPNDGKSTDTVLLIPKF